MSGSSRGKQTRNVEIAVAILFVLAVLGGGGAVFYFFATVSPVHTDPATVPSMVEGAPDARVAGLVAQGRQAARVLAVDQNLPALTVAVARAGGSVWSEAFGWADAEGRVPATPATRFRIGAVSMSLTSAAVGLLRDRGTLDLDAPVRQYVPSFPEKAWPFSTRQVMGHVSGIQHPGPPSRPCRSLDDALPIFSGDPLLFRPGTQYRYSYYGWMLVSKVVEAVAGQPFPTFMSGELFEPLGMVQTGLDAVDGVPGRATLHFPRAAMRPNLGLQEAPRADYSCWAGAGGYVSTASDLARFGAAMLKPGFLKADTLSLIQSLERLESGASTGAGLGWMIGDVRLAGATTRLVSQRGSPSGGTVSLLLFPDADLVVAVATNVSHVEAIGPFALTLAETFAKAPVLTAPPHGGVNP